MKPKIALARIRKFGTTFFRTAPLFGEIGRKFRRISEVSRYGLKPISLYTSLIGSAGAR